MNGFATARNPIPPRIWRRSRGLSPRLWNTPPASMKGAISKVRSVVKRLRSKILLRSKIFDLNLFTTDLTFEMAPFIDAGGVFHNLGDNPLDRLHILGGMGFRAVAKPFIVGYVDIGYGSEGTAIF